MTQFSDGLTNVLTGLGVPDKDKMAGTAFGAYTERPRTYWRDMMRSSGLASRIVTTPAEDATREWRSWNADPEQISAIEAYENKLDIATALRMAEYDKRALGRGFVYFDLGDDPETPVNLNTVRSGQLRFVRWISECDVADGEIEADPMSEFYGMPRRYWVVTSNGGQYIHPSRLIKRYGHRVVGGGTLTCKHDGDLQRCHDAILQHDAIRHNIAALTHEAKVDIWMIPGLWRVLSDPTSEDAFLKAQHASNMLKGIHGTVFQDAGDKDNPTKYERKGTSFATLPDIAAKAEDYVCAVSGFSKAYLFGESGAGMGNNGQSTLEMDYGKIAQIQRGFDGAMHVFNEVLIRSALGSRPPEIYHEWNSLWEMSDADRAKIALDTANAFKIMKETGEIPEGVLTVPMINTMTERGGIVGLESAYQEWEAGGGQEDRDFAQDDEVI